ncbi:glycosyltransferase family protein [Cohnella lupini]|uniref:Glycosyl transferase family 2 n=1 Tax=Cohnella lupini TaxID=1294267 RepID=A0A3D9IW30_9BACL|nr:glycosyltransferase family protein [Cohnella lupini]RED65942.1 glycosyl transferase family 2 [Cohnella lupini]
MINPNKLAFICCVNDAKLFEECLAFINALDIPMGIVVDMIPIFDAPGIAVGYQRAMKQSNAKYKVYLHQDTLIIHRKFIEDIIHIFRNNSSIGLIGVIGAKELPENAIWWDSTEKTGKVFLNTGRGIDLLDYNPIPYSDATHSVVEAVDGLLLATQVDLPWRDDLFAGWHFYDSSQCMEVIRAGYQVVIPHQDSPWCLHDCKIAAISYSFQEARGIFCAEYSDDRKTTGITTGGAE